MIDMARGMRSGHNRALVTLAVGAVLLLAGAGPFAEGEDPVGAGGLEIKGVFHVIGAPELPRGKKCDLALSDKEAVFTTGAKVRLRLPFTSIQRAIVGTGSRDRLGAALAVGMISWAGEVTALTQKKHADSVSIDYTAPSGANIRMVLQMDRPFGGACAEWLKRAGVKVEQAETKQEPAVTGATGPAPKPDQ
jgi:hypothetical protein